VINRVEFADSPLLDDLFGNKPDTSLTSHTF
jgi:hypothetical protein